MVSRFLTLVGSLSLEEQKLWFPNQVVHDPDTWTSFHLLHLKSEYDVLVNKYGYIIQEMYTVQDPETQTLLRSSQTKPAPMMSVPTEPSDTVTCPGNQYAHYVTSLISPLYSPESSSFLI
jgi:hypothetical protein